MNRTPCWQIDAFTDRPFAGNPAAVCFLKRDATADWMQAVASEMNLSETAFVQRRAGEWELRWFTPAAEVDLCGHATLAAAHALWTSALASREEPLRFHTRSGALTCTWSEGLIELDFPALPALEVGAPSELVTAIRCEPIFVGRTKYDYLLALANPDAVRNCHPDFRQLVQVPTRGIIITSRSDDPQYDFISRTFFPAIGVDEDPVCGSAHCSTAVFWGAKLGKTKLLAYQASPRGGVVSMRCEGERVILGGKAVTVWEGTLMA